MRTPSRSTWPCRSGSLARTVGVLLELADEDAHAAQRGPDGRTVAVEAEQDERLAADEGVADQGRELGGREGPERAELGLRLGRDLRQQLVPTDQERPHRG